MIRKDFKFKKLKNFLTLEEIALLKDYVIIRNRINEYPPKSDEVSQEPNFYMYGDAVFDSLMLQKRKRVEEETGLKLLPTYSYFRMYTQYSSLKKHSDRPSCEISVTALIDSDGTEWPIYMDGNPVYLEPGEAAIYLGAEVEHWRDEFKGDYASQVFMHYVDRDGSHTDYYKDKRDLYGTKALIKASTL